MTTPVSSDSKGFTLLEFLVALVILTFGILALLQSVNLAISHNMTNQLRLEGAMVADSVLATELSKGGTTAGFAAISTVTSKLLISQKVMNGFRNYSVTKVGSSVTDNTKRVDVVVAWRYKKDRFQHGASTLISKIQ
ncbi:prepilin-type N-terminal cleavage/methylation domain-containing protein [Geobacter pelophilus]|uniref:Prepilin-type N-terminal cleavage/methylation domain-containing protein n=1 Tax=Geoanaerobacter pelophilus TaxID=60036 RepID=A0AAW4L3U4_9BACT|nr:prepilin-type N-terminal cleavage/methylation domain-containing protein [Geoanaerobacter pelophilus]